MKRVLIGMLAVGLIAVLSMPALAVDVKVSGLYEVAGYWESNRAMKSSDEIAQKYYTTWLRIEPVFKVAEGLQLVTRFEGMERMVGRDGIGADITGTNARNTKAEQDLTVRRMFISAKTLGGRWDVGYQSSGSFGADFLDYDGSVFRIKATYFVGPFTLVFVPTEKVVENTLGTPNTSDSDSTNYAVAGIYKWSSGQAGYLQYYAVNNTTEQSATNPYRKKYFLGVPYVKATFGPLYVEGEIDYVWGKKCDYLDSTTQNISYKSFSWYVMGKYTMGPAYIGAQVATVAGDDPSTTDTDEAFFFQNAGTAYGKYKPVLILWNDWTSRFTGQSWGTNTGSNVGTGGIPINVRLYQIFGGYKPLNKLSLDAAFTMMTTDQKPLNYVSDKYGNEFDISASYKVYDNLTYTVAFGYLWAGDYWKGTSDTNTVGNDWLLMHKLTLNF